MLSQSNTREKRQGERVNEWLPICSIPLLKRLVPRVQIYPCLVPLAPSLLIPQLPPRIVPLRTRLTPEHNGRPISLSPLDLPLHV